MKVILGGLKDLPIVRYEAKEPDRQSQAQEINHTRKKELYMLSSLVSHNLLVFTVWEWVQLHL